MLGCYGLASSVRRGVDSVPFLTRMARDTLPGGHRIVIPYPLEAKEDTGGVLGEARGEADVHIEQRGQRDKEAKRGRGADLPRGVQ